MEKRNINKVSSPRDVVGDLRLIKSLYKKVFSLFNTTKSAEDSRQKHSGMTSLFNYGFTLIELLVVVLIIGILSAIALPQYQKAVEKSKAATILSLLKSVAQAEEVFYLTNGYYTNNLEDLDLAIPWTGHTTWANNWPSSLSNEEWSFQTNLQTPNLSAVSTNALAIGRITGDYKGAGFIYIMNIQPEGSANRKPGLYCAERQGNGMIFEKQDGSYCSLFQQEKQTPIGVLSSYLYRM